MRLWGHSFLYGDGNNGWKFPNRRRVILLDPHQPSQDIVPITWPSIYMCVLKPVRDVALFSPREQNGNEPEILASILDEFILELLVYVNCVEGPLVILQADRGGRHRLVVLGTDDDDDQILFLTEVPLHEVNLAYTSELLLKNVNMCVKAVVPQQSNKVDDLVDVFVIVRFISDKHPPLLQRQPSAVGRVLLFDWHVVANLCKSGFRNSAVTWIVRATSWMMLRPGVFGGHRAPVEVNRALSTTGSSLRWARVRRERVVTQLR